MPPVGCKSADKPEWKGFTVLGEDGVMDARKFAAPGPVNSCCSLWPVGQETFLRLKIDYLHMAHIENASLFACPVVRVYNAQV